MTNFRFDWQDTQAGDRIKAAEDFAYNHQPSAASIFTSAVEANSLTYRLLHMAGQGDVVDPNYTLTPERVKEVSDQFGIPMEHMGFARDAASDQHLLRMAYDTQQTLQAKNTLSAAGWKGSAASMLVSTLDPTSLATMFTPAGVAGWMNKGGALAGAIKSGLVAGGINAGLQAGLAATDGTSDPHEVIQAGLMGLAMGAPLGALGGHLAKAAHDGFIETTLRRAAADGHTLTPEGEARLSTAVVPYVGAREGEFIPADKLLTEQRPALPRPTIEGEATRVEEPTAFLKGDKVEWTGKDGKTETGTVHDVLPNGQYLLKDESGNIRSTRESTMKDDPSSFMGGSIGSGQRLAVEGATVHNPVLKIGPWKVPLRFDSYAFFQRSENPFIKQLGNLLLEDEVGKATTIGANGEKIFSANHATAEAYANVEYKRFESQAHSAIEDQFNAYAQRMGLSNVQKFQLEKSGEWHQTVSKILRGDTALAAAHPEAAAAAREIASVNKIVLEKLKAAGVHGAEHIEENANYLWRKFNHDKLGLLMANPELRPKIIQLFAEAINRGRANPLPMEKAQEVAKGYLDWHRKFNLDKSRMGFLSETGREEFAKALQANSKLDPEEIDNVLNWMYGRKEAKTDVHSSRLKDRVFMDETHSIRWTDANGAERNLSISDFLENDIRVLNRAYYKQMSGAIGLAKVGLRSKQDLEELLANAQEHFLNNNPNNIDINKYTDGIRAVVRNLTGMPMYEGFGSRMERGLRTLKNVNYITYMAQGAFAQAAEYGQYLAQKTIMAARTNMSAVDQIMREAAAGTMDSRLARDMKAMGVVAEETQLRQHVFTESAYDGIDKHLSTVDNWAAQGSSWVSKYSGMAPLTDWQRGKLVRLYAQRLTNIASGAEKLDDGMLKRLATNGLEGDQLESVLAKIREYSTIDAGTKELLHIDYEAWEKASPKTYDLYRLALHREGHRGIQEISLGSTPLWMHKSTAKLLFQFRSFVMSAWTKQLMYGANHRDLQTFANWTFTTVVAGLSYYAQTALNYAGADDLDKRLSAFYIATAAFNRAGFSSLIPSVVDTGTGILAGEPIFAHGRSTGLGTGFAAGIPTLSTANKLGSVLGGAAQSALVPDHRWLQADVRQSLGLLPNYYGIRTLVNNFAQDFPKHAPQPQTFITEMKQ